MEEIENIKNELNEIKTARDNIKTALENEGETVTNDIRTYADTIPNVNKVKTVNSVEADENKNVQLDASKINVDDMAETKQTIKETIETLDNSIKSRVCNIVIDETMIGKVNPISDFDDGCIEDIELALPKMYEWCDGVLAHKPEILVTLWDTDESYPAYYYKGNDGTLKINVLRTATYNIGIKTISENSSSDGLYLQNSHKKFTITLNHDSSYKLSTIEIQEYDEKTENWTKLPVLSKDEKVSSYFVPSYNSQPTTKGYVDSAIKNITVPDYSIIETTVTEGYSKTYSLTKDGAEVGVKINIPKDLVVNKGSVKVVATEGTPYEGAVVGDKYLDIELNDPTKDHIYIPVKELVDVYTAGDGIEISADNVIKSKNSNLINGSAVGSIKGINAKSDNSTYTIGEYASAFGTNTAALGDNSHAEGRSTSADGHNAHAEGANSSARGESSHAEGNSTMAKGSSSHAEGIYTVASAHYQHVQGRYNIEDTNNRYAHIVGNGSNGTARSNAHTVAWDGTGWFQGNVKVGGTSQNDTNAKQLATEEYVDDKYNTESITEIVSADKEPGYTFTFGKLCDSVMVFLNGEKLIAQKSSSQTIDEYSYIENKTDNKITSVTFTNDFTITTGDRIEAILINPSEISIASEISESSDE